MRTDGAVRRLPRGVSQDPCRLSAFRADLTLAWIFSALICGVVIISAVVGAVTWRGVPAGGYAMQVDLITPPGSSGVA